jgi:hypothetical protein
MLAPGWIAIIIIAVFIVAVGVLNKVEFGRVD